MKHDIRIVTWYCEDRRRWGVDVLQIDPYDDDEELLHEVDAIHPDEEGARIEARNWLQAEGIEETRRRFRLIRRLNHDTR